MDQCIFQGSHVQNCGPNFRATQRSPNISNLRAAPEISVGFPFPRWLPRSVQLGHLKVTLELVLAGRPCAGLLQP